MRIVLTGSSGRLGRAIFNVLAANHSVVGIDRSPFSTTHLLGDFTDAVLLRQALTDADAIVHCAALHAPHVAAIPDDEFRRINVDGTRFLAEVSLAAGVKRLVFTSTTALYGHAAAPGRCTWIDEDAVPQPKSIYHRTKLDAERILADMASPDLQVRVLRMSRSFPEPANVMAAYRLHRGVDIRDVADAHVAALTNGGEDFQRHIVSASTLFKPEDCEALAVDAASVIRLRAPGLAAKFAQRNWPLPQSIDRVYASKSAGTVLGWHFRFGYDEILAQLDRESLEVLTPVSRSNRQPE
ncbi:MULTISPECIES: NAD(P)-dependent oxidoreductase [unclassified Rhizobium]|uniref:NAD-dependent epimerase/dehydratase family protein n=1 Tax=unclassified Rhizobium TaxID=2613769 RepID=UPI000EA84C9D|nr:MULTISPECIES: NAD(P)-dependent oxidoreductase [unclassified Rhizobium]AYG68180.1 NAD(P)-dependent oxidoreductase [Rhizobium sp. CCGE531]AYG74562.1 NAD(P)-dependent oxidoreductase [Rhizobium sp. CCGE532]